MRQIRSMLHRLSRPQFLKMAAMVTAAPTLLAYCHSVIAVPARGSSDAQTKRAELWLYNHCDRTTEFSEDELYFLVSVDDGKPEKNGPFDINDNGSKRKVTRRIFEKDLAPGEKVKLLVTIMESDGGPPPGLIDALTQGAGQFAKDKGSDGAAFLIPILGGLLKVVLDDKDDFLGTLAVTISNEGGRIITKVSPASDGMNQEEVIKVENPVHPFRFQRSGDRHNYHVAIWEGGPRPSEPQTP
jgi:hypothetical protein